MRTNDFIGNVDWKPYLKVRLRHAVFESKRFAKLSETEQPDDLLEIKKWFSGFIHSVPPEVGGTYWFLSIVAAFNANEILTEGDNSPAELVAINRRPNEVQYVFSKPDGTQIPYPAPGEYYPDYVAQQFFYKSAEDLEIDFMFNFLLKFPNLRPWEWQDAGGFK